MDLFHKPISLFDIFPIDTLQYARNAHDAANQTIVIDENASNVLHAYVKKTVLTAQTHSKGMWYIGIQK